MVAGSVTVSVRPLTYGNTNSSKGQRRGGSGRVRWRVGRRDWDVPIRVEGGRQGPVDTGWRLGSEEGSPGLRVAVVCDQEPLETPLVRPSLSDTATRSQPGNQGTGLLLGVEMAVCPPLPRSLGALPPRVPPPEPVVDVGMCP